MGDREVRWKERGRAGELHYVVGIVMTAGWEFFEKSCYEMQWFPLPATDERKATAERLLDAQSTERG